MHMLCIDTNRKVEMDSQRSNLVVFKSYCSSGLLSIVYWLQEISAEIRDITVYPSEVLCNNTVNVFSYAMTLPLKIQDSFHRLVSNMWNTLFHALQQGKNGTFFFVTG